MERKLRLEASSTTTAAAEVVWSMVSDANRFPAWGPWREGGYRPAAAGPSAPGAIQWFRLGRTVSVEEVLEVEAPHRLVYRVIKGIPVKNYRAEVSLRSAPAGGTAIRWAATWDNTFLGRIVHRKLRRLYPEIVAALAAAAERAPVGTRPRREPDPA